MDCHKFKRNLEDYLQGGLDFAGRFGMERHARQCLDCGRLVSDSQNLGDLAREMARVRAPEGFEAVVMRRIQQERSRRHSWSLERFWIYGWQRLSGRTIAVAASVLGLVLAAAVVTRLYVSREGPPGARSDDVATASDDTSFPPAPAETELVPQFADGAGRNLRGGYFNSERGWVPASVEPADSEFFEFTVPAPGDGEFIMRLPKQIRMRSDPPSEEYYIRNVSH